MNVSLSSAVFQAVMPALRSARSLPSEHGVLSRIWASNGSQYQRMTNSLLLRMQRPRLMHSKAMQSSFYSQNTSLPLPRAGPLKRLLHRQKWSKGFRYSTTAASASSPASAAQAKPGLRAKLKELTTKYGWATVAVYVLFSLLDFSLVFFVINLIGAEHVRRGQDYLLDALVYGSESRRVIAKNEQTGEDEWEGNGWLGFLKEWREKHKEKDEHNQAAEQKGKRSSIWATAVLAYTIHKTLLLPVRLGLTAATTPWIVKTLQGWGLNIARSPIPEAARMRSAQAIKSQKQKFDKAKERHSNWL